jgi:hypothetical protein
MPGVGASGIRKLNSKIGSRTPDLPLPARQAEP